VYLYNRYQSDKHLISDDKLVEIKDLIHDPEKVFRRLQHERFEDMQIDEKLLDSSIKASKSHSHKKYEIEKEYIDRLNKELGSLIEIQVYKTL